MVDWEKYKNKAKGKMDDMQDDNDNTSDTHSSDDDREHKDKGLI